MRPVIQPWAEFLRNEEGRTAIKCAVILALIMVVCIGWMGVLGCASPAKG
jgi:Flp pilus assembly pilin Flp